METFTSLPNLGPVIAQQLIDVGEEDVRADLKAFYTQAKA